MRLGQPESPTTGSCRPHAMEKYNDDPWLSSSRARSTPASRTCVTASSRTRLALQRAVYGSDDAFERMPLSDESCQQVAPTCCRGILGIGWPGLSTADASAVSFPARANNGGGKLIPQAPRLPEPVRECAASELTLVPSFGRATKDAMTDFAVHEKAGPALSSNGFCLLGGWEK